MMLILRKLLDKFKKCYTSFCKNRRKFTEMFKILYQYDNLVRIKQAVRS